MKGCAGPVEATPTPRHRHPGDLEPADSGSIECAVSSAEEIDDELESARRTFGRIMPLTWVSHSDRELMTTVEFLLRKILDTSGTPHGSRGILPIDAQTLSNVVAEEIAQNVADHSGRTWGLMCAWSVSSEFWERLGTQSRIEKFAEQFLKPEAE